MTAKEQLEKWVNGNSIHNIERDECCPDFSCCDKTIHTDIETKQRFQKAYLENDQATVSKMLTMFLTGLLPKTNIHITGGEINLNPKQ